MRTAATLLITIAALITDTLAAAGVVAGALLVAWAGSPDARARARVVTRPILSLAVMLVALQYAFGREVTVELVPGIDIESPVLVAGHRIMQIASVLIATLLLTAATSAPDLGAALRWCFRPLRLLRVPVDDAALVIATALAIVPNLDAELERIRRARAARGITARRSDIRARIRLEALVVAPLLVTSFRRARLLADALVVRGVDPRAEPVPWRPRTTPPVDLVGLVSAMILLALSWYG